MKQKLTPIIFIFIIMTSCVSNIEKVVIPTNPNITNTGLNHNFIDDWTVRIDGETLDSLSQSNEAFLVYLGNPSCSGCIQFQPNLISWIDETDALVHYFDTLENLHQLSLIQDQFPNYFSEGFSTPCLYIFLETTRLHRIAASEAFYSYPRFKALMANFIQVTES